MADVFEDRRDLDAERVRLWALIAQTPWLDWLLLTKRPECVRALAPWGDKWPRNVWLGTTVEDQRRAEERLPILAGIPAAVRFISAEPLLGKLDLAPWRKRLDWVIAGGESGRKARSTHPAWFNNLNDQCVKADIAFHFKQWGDWAPGKVGARSEKRTCVMEGGVTMVRYGKKHAGRMLRGMTWDQAPVPRRT